MFREMRRKRQQLSQEEIRELIARAEYATLGVIGDGGWPYTVPVNTVLLGDTLYFHCAASGHKLDAIRKEPRVSLSFVETAQVLSREYATRYRSAQVFGRAYVVTEEAERQRAFRALSERFSADALDRYEAVMAKESHLAVIIGVEIRQLSGKCSLDLMAHK